jgi:hypothetical protein
MTTTNQRRLELDSEIERYREVATLTLEQLRWRSTTSTPTATAAC